ncbi:hypothetical protein Golax_000181, partial [Gossypium laxum]|nr:hypothetical protein [Gossypium laxum]
MMLSAFCLIILFPHEIQPSNYLISLFSSLLIVCVWVVFYGNHALFAILSQADILLRGYFGWNSRRAIQVLDHVFPKDASTQPELIITYFGGNDSMGAHPSGLGPHVPLPEYIENMKQIVNYLKGLSDSTRLIFLTSPPVNEERVNKYASEHFSHLVRTNELCQTYADACVKLCQELDVKVVNLFTAFQQRENWMTDCF